MNFACDEPHSCAAVAAHVAAFFGVFHTAPFFVPFEEGHGSWIWLKSASFLKQFSL